MYRNKVQKVVKMEQADEDATQPGFDSAALSDGSAADSDSQVAQLLHVRYYVHVVCVQFFLDRI